MEYRTILRTETDQGLCGSVQFGLPEEVQSRIGFAIPECVHDHSGSGMQHMRCPNHSKERNPENLEKKWSL
jgi:hypothetical protein